MKIEANMRIINKQSLVAVGSVTLDDVITIHSVKLLDLTTAEEKEQGKENWVISMPRRKGIESWSSVAVLRDPQIKEQVEQAVYDAVKKNLTCDLEFEPQIDVQVIPYRNGTLVGYANVLYEKAVELRSIQIHRIDEELQIKLPYNLYEDKFQILLQVNTERMKDRILQKVEEAYLKKVPQQDPKKKKTKGTKTQTQRRPER